MSTAAGLLPPKNPETTPDKAAPFCLPLTSHVITSPPTDPPVLKLQSVLPVFVSTATAGREIAVRRVPAPFPNHRAHSSDGSCTTV